MWRSKRQRSGRYGDGILLKCSLSRITGAVLKRLTLSKCIEFNWLRAVWCCMGLHCTRFYRLTKSAAFKIFFLSITYLLFGWGTFIRMQEESMDIRYEWVVVLIISDLMPIKATNEWFSQICKIVLYATINKEIEHHHNNLTERMDKMNN